MKKPTLYHEQILAVLRNLKKEYPNQGLGRHISSALSDYGDCWDISDKEFLFALEKYESELQINTAPEPDVQRIIKESSSLESLRAGIDLDEEEGDQYGN